MNSSNADFLVDKLRAVRRDRQLQRIFDEEYEKIFTCVNVYDEDDNKQEKNKLNRNNVNNTFDYVDKYFMLGINSKVNFHLNENSKAKILWDFANIPRELVFQRLVREGCQLEKEI
jgi:hypothetical protein